MDPGPWNYPHVLVCEEHLEVEGKCPVEDCPGPFILVPSSGSPYNEPNESFS